MSRSKYDLAVAYRIYPRVSKSPPLFADDKLRLAEFCLKSFRASLGDLRAKLFVLLDACPPEYEVLFRDHFDASDLELIRLEGIGNRPTFGRQIEILLTQDCAEAVYFAEDDYFYLPGQFNCLVEFLRNNADAHFVSPYDHPDYYTLPLHNPRQEVRVTADHHWRTSASTCLTFLTTKSTLARTKRAFLTYSRRNLDVSLWMSLTKQTVFEPRRIFRCLQHRIAMAGYVAMAWFYGWPQILFQRRRKLWIPLPSIATHMEAAYLAPGIDWHGHFEQNKSATQNSSVLSRRVR